MEQRKSMLDLVRRTCGGANAMPDFEATYEPDEVQVRAWERHEAEDFGGKTRFLNLPPGEVKRRLEVATDPDEVEALKVAERTWANNRGYAGFGTEAGTVDRGDARVAIRAGSMRELAKASAASRASAIVSGGCLRAGGVPTFRELTNPGELGRLGDMIDWGSLAGLENVPEPVSDDDWF